MSYAIIYCRGRMCVAFTMDLGLTPVRCRKCDSNIEKFLLCASISDFDGLENVGCQKAYVIQHIKEFIFSLGRTNDSDTGLFLLYETHAFRRVLVLSAGNS